MDASGIVFYDADCWFCVRLANCARPFLARRRFQLLPMQTSWFAEQSHLSPAEIVAEMWLLRPDGQLFGGADALLEISRHYWWTWPLRRMTRLTAVMKLFRAAYGWIARHRPCADGACVVAKTSAGRTIKRQHPRWHDAAPFVILPLLALALRHRVAPWVFMWLMALAIYAGCKWLTFRLALRQGLKPPWWRALAYLLGWPGMDAHDFFSTSELKVRSHKSAWFSATANILLGAILVWGIVRRAYPGHPLLAGWIGMTGVVLMLHFGLFHILALTWQRAGINASPLMDQPILARSLAEFWGRRWNTAFNELAFRFTFTPLRRRISPIPAMLLVFGLSGLVHELVISLPARGGYGLPTAYFLIQASGMLVERTPAGRSIGLGCGWRGWLFNVFVTVGPAFWLFPPPFINHVILPLLAAMGAT